MDIKERAIFKHVSNSFGAAGGIETVNANFVNQTFSKHVHEGYTIGIIDSGAQKFFRSGDEHIAGKGSVILVNADDVHTGRSATEAGWSYRALYPKPEHFGSICKGVFSNSKGIPYFRSAVVEDSSLADQLRLFFSLSEVQNDSLLIHSVLSELVINLVKRHSNRHIEYSADRPRRLEVLRIKDYLEQMYHQSPTLDTLSSISGLSPFHLVRIFKEQVGMPPHQYLVQVRLKRAKELLRRGDRPSQVAVDCGFYDQSHLNIQFKRALGTTPFQYQKNSNYLQ